MDNLLIASIVLILTNISFALLANHWRRQAKRQAAAAVKLALRSTRSRETGYRAGWIDGERHATGRMYTAAIKAERVGADILAALRGQPIEATPEAEEIAA